MAWEGGEEGGTENLQNGEEEQEPEGEGEDKERDHRQAWEEGEEGFSD